MAAFFYKISVLFGKNSTFTQSNSLMAVSEIFLVLFSVFVRWKVTINENISFTDNLATGLLKIRHKLKKWQWCHNLLTWCQLQVFDVVFFLLSSLVTVLNFMLILSLVLELWQFLFIGDWPEIWKSEILPSKFCPISGDWGRMSRRKCYRMSQNAKVTVLTVLELLRGNQQGRG